MQLRNVIQSKHGATVGKRAFQGAAIALIMISVFLLMSGRPNPHWSQFWMIRPLLVVPAAGALGGVFFYLVDFLRMQGGWRNVLANTLSALVFVIGLWMGTVLGLAGTMWH